MGNITVYLNAVDDGYTLVLKSAKHEIDMFNLSAKAMQASMNALRMYSMSAAMALGAMVLPGLLVSKMLADYDLTVRRIMAAGGAEFAGHFDEVTARIARMSAEFGIAKEEIASGILELAKAGFQYSQIMDEMLIPITQLAIANGKDFAMTTETATVAWQLYGEEVGSAARMMQIMHTVAIETLADIDDFLTVFEYAGALAVTTGISFEEFMAQIGALSQLAFHSGMTLGTFFARLRSIGPDMERILGAAPGSIVKEGQVNLTELNRILHETTSLTVEQQNELSTLWGVRADKVFYAIKETADVYDYLYGVIASDNTSLADGFEEMKGSIQYIWQQIIGVLQEPLLSAATLDEIASALTDFKNAIAEGDLGTQIRDMVLTSLDFLATNGPQLIEILGNFLDTLEEITPTLMDISKGFMSFAEFISNIPTPLLMLIGTFIIFNKIIPVTTTLMALMKYAVTQNAVSVAALQTQYGGLIPQTTLLSVSQTRAMMSTQLLSFRIGLLGKTVMLTRMQFMMLNVAMMAGVMVGFMMLVTGKDKVTRALGAIIAVVSILAMIMWQLAAASVAAQSGIGSIVTLPMFAAAAIATMAAIGGYLYFQNKSTEGMAVGGYMTDTGWKYLHRGEYVIPEAKFGKAVLDVFPEMRQPVSGDTTNSSATENYFDNRTINVYDAGADDLERGLHERGRFR